MPWYIYALPEGHNGTLAILQGSVVLISHDQTCYTHLQSEGKQHRKDGIY